MKDMGGATFLIGIEIHGDRKRRFWGCLKVPTLIRFLKVLECLTGSLWELPSIKVMDSTNYSVLRMNSSTNGRKTVIKLHL